MKIPPSKMGNAKVLLFATIDDRHKHTGKTKHFVGGELMASSPNLAICQYEGEESCYLFYCDKNWEVISDTLHDDLEEAKRHAEFEYEGITETWESL